MEMTIETPHTGQVPMPHEPQNKPSLWQAIQPKSIQARITLWTGLCLFIAAAIIIGYAALSLGQRINQGAEGHAAALAQTESLRIQTTMEDALGVSQTLAQTLLAVKASEDSIELEREHVITILKHVLEQNPDFVGIGTLWEPNAFDGKDTTFAGERGHDQTGQFIPYWSRDSQGTIKLDPLVDFDPNDKDNYYGCSVQTKRECITEPYSYDIQGEEVWMTSLVVPIIADGQFYGIVGTDIRMDFLQTIADSVNIYDHSTKLTLITNKGTLAAVTGQSNLIGQSATTIYPDINAIVSRIQGGERVVILHEEESVDMFTPIFFGDTETPWTLRVTIPHKVMTSEANLFVGRLVQIGSLLTIASLLLLWIVARQIAIPIRKLTVAAQSVASGNLDVRADVKTSDETGILAKTFNQMVYNLRQNAAQERQELEERQALQKQVIEAQETSIRELSSPLIPVADRVVIMPLIGTIDSNRGQLIMDMLLRGVYEHQARIAILDVTGVKVIDTQVANMLIQSAQAVRLLGSQVILTGINSTVAQMLIHLGVDLSGIVTHSTLQEGITYAIAEQKRMTSFST